jgi:hypothetical protein
MGGRGGAHHEEGGMPAIGFGLAGALLIGAVKLVRMPFSYPGMAIRVVCAAIVGTPLMVLASSDGPAWNHLWFILYVFCMAGWCSSAPDKPKNYNARVQESWRNAPLAPWEDPDE